MHTRKSETISEQQRREAENPELLILRARKLYEKKGYSRRWVNKRMGGISARQELTSEWHKRGATDSEQFRELTNELTRGAFGMDVQGYRKYKGLAGAGANLRDHMSDLELILVSLGETAAVAIHQARDSYGFDALRSDTTEAAQIVAQTREQLEKRCGRPITTPANHLRPVRYHGRSTVSELAKRAKDMHNPDLPHPARTVA